MSERVRRYLSEELGLEHTPEDVIGWLINSHRALLSEQKPGLGEPPDGEITYRYCLDALIATAYELRLLAPPKAFAGLRAELRAGELAGRLFDKWIGEWK